MQQPLLISSLLVHAERHHGDREVVSRRVEGDIHRYTYREMAARARRLANALAALGVKPSERVGTLAWNGYRHMELYYAVSGAGAVLHTINPRLHPDQIAYIADHAEDQVLCFDLSFLPLVAGGGRAHEDDQPLRRDDRPRAHAGRSEDARTCSATRIWSPPSPTSTSGPSSTRTPPARSATPRAPPATPRACSTATARRCCTPSRSRCPTR
ncbi:MAG: AMP-binding protein [Rubrivivax sp.]